MRILLVEDDRSLSRAVSTILQKNNYTVDCVDNGQLALDYLEQDIYDMVMLCYHSSYHVPHKSLH